MSAVTAVVVNWNGAEFLAPCLESLLGQRGVEVRPVVLDNGSTDGSLELLARRFPDVPVERTGANNYTAANNLGVARAEGDHALLVNTDARLDPDCAARLREALEADAGAAGAAPLILGEDGRVDTSGIAERADHYWVDRDHGAAAPEHPAPPEEVFGISGCVAMFRTAAWRQVGGQDEAFHMYYEDVDLCLRLRAAGWHLLLVPGARAVHVGHGSIRKAAVGKDPRGERNRLLVLARHEPAAFADALVRSPWFAQAGDAERAETLGLLAGRLAAADGTGREGRELLLDAFARGIGGLVTREVVAADGRNLLEEREEWIATLLGEVARLRLYRLPGRRLKPVEKDFLARRAQRGK